MSAVSAFKFEVRADEIAVITTDVLGEKVNTLKAEFGNQVRGLTRQVRDNKSVRGMVSISAKADNFIAGAGISVITHCRSVQEAEALAHQGQQIMAEIHGLSIPMTAAIHGAYPGGGPELALARHGRVRSDDEKTRLSLPKAQLGLLPGSGETQCLPRLIGISIALGMMLTGKQLCARQTLKAGLVGEVAPQVILLQAAAELALKGRPASRDMPVRERMLAGPLGRHPLFHFVGKQTQHKIQGNYPMVKRIPRAVENGLIRSCSSGYAEEACVFGELVMTLRSQALRSVFFASTNLKKNRGIEAEPGPLTSIAVLGGSLMGGGAAYVITRKGGLSVRIRDIQPHGTSHASKHSWDLLSRQVHQRRLRFSERDRRMALIFGVADYQGFVHRDVVIEAVFGDLVLKQRAVSKMEQYYGSQTIFTSNASLLPIGDIAVRTSRPEQVVGLHFFSPAEKVPLVRVIPHEGTDPQAIAVVVQLAKRQEKTSIVVADRAGSYVNRTLTPRANEAMRLLVEGEPAGEIDKALAKFGFPIGPIQLLDEAGVDTGTEIILVLENAFGERFSPPANIADVILRDDRKGRKSNRGFYLYETKGRKSGKRSDPTVYPLPDIDRPQSWFSAQQVAEHYVTMMLNEAVHCFDEQITHSAHDGDVDAVFGIGFLSLLGDPLRYINTIGVGEAVTTLRRLAAQYGPRFTPCDTLLRMVKQGTTFWPTDERLI